MKKQLIKTTVSLALLVLGSVVAASAQVAPRMEVDVPFDFLVGKATLKAGAYSVKKTTGNVLQFRSADGKQVAVVNAPLTIGSRDYKSGERLVFTKYGDQYFLSQVWLSIETGIQLMPSSGEVRAARESKLAGRAKPEKLEVAFRHR